MAQSGASAFGLKPFIVGPVGKIIITREQYSIGGIIRLIGQAFYDINLNKIHGLYVELCINLPARAITGVSTADNSIHFRFDQAFWDRAVAQEFISERKSQAWGLRSVHTAGTDTSDIDRYIPFLEIESVEQTGIVSRLLSGLTIHYDEDIAREYNDRLKTSLECSVMLSVRDGTQCKIASHPDTDIRNKISFNIFGAIKYATAGEWVGNQSTPTHTVDARGQDATMVRLGPRNGYGPRLTRERHPVGELLFGDTRLGLISTRIEE